jgi:hypothetical protein
MKKDTFHISFHLPVVSRLLSIAAPEQDRVPNSNADQPVIIQRFLKQILKYKVLRVCRVEQVLVKVFTFPLNIFSLSKK